MNYKDKCSWAVLWPAAASGQDVVKLLLEKGANADSKDQWISAAIICQTGGVRQWYGSRLLIVSRFPGYSN